MNKDSTSQSSSFSKSNGMIALRTTIIENTVLQMRGSWIRYNSRMSDLTERVKEPTCFN